MSAFAERVHTRVFPPRLCETRRLCRRCARSSLSRHGQSDIQPSGFITAYTEPREEAFCSSWRASLSSLREPSQPLPAKHSCGGGRRGPALVAAFGSVVRGPSRDLGPL